MKIGRPNEELSRKVTVKLTEDMYSKIVFLANKEKVSVSECVRKILKKSMS